jgi:CBS domain-containing protein
MQRDIITVSADDSLRDALKLMIENHVTGLPVMDRNSRCIGLITTTDVLNYQEEHANDEPDGTTRFFDPESQQWEDVPLLAFTADDFDEVRVADVMTRDLIWARRDAPLQEVAQRMVDERIHRVLVMDDKLQLYGIVSAFDFVRGAAEC